MLRNIVFSDGLNIILNPLLFLIHNSNIMLSSDYPYDNSMIRKRESYCWVTTYFQFYKENKVFVFLLILGMRKAILTDGMMLKSKMTNPRTGSSFIMDTQNKNCPLSYISNLQIERYLTKSKELDILFQILWVYI